MARIPVDLAADPEDDRALQAWVDCGVDGAAVRMLLDTGSRRSAVPASVATRPTIQPSSSGRGVSGSVDPAPTSTIERLSIGDTLECRELAVDVQPDGWPHPPHLGRQVFEHRPCDLRLAERLIETDADRPASAITAGSCWNGSHPATVTLTWPDTELNALVDTGAGITIVAADWAERHPDAIIVTDVEDQGTDVTGNAVAGRRGRLRPYAIAGLQFPEQECGVVDLSGLNQHLTDPIRMILGLPQLVLAHWFLDPSDGTLSIHPLR